MTEITTKTPRWVKITLGVSLCLNLLVLGAVGGAILSGGHGSRQIVGQDPVRQIYRALPREARKSLTSSIRAKAPPKGNRKAWSESFLAELRSEDFDPAAIQSLLAARQERMNAFSSNGQTALIDILSNMSAKERAELADNFEEGMKKKRFKKR